MVADWVPAAAEASLQHKWDDTEWDANVVTVMMRQIPRHFTQQALLKEVIAHGFEGLFDFLYLPWDLKKNNNVGYGFISFADPRIALSFRDAFDGAYLDAPAAAKLKEKPLRVHPASLQGYQANYQHFVHTKTGQKQDPLYSPLFFPGSGVNSLSALLHTACPGTGGGPKGAAGSRTGAGPSWEGIALAEAAILGWAGLPAAAPAAEGLAPLGGSEDRVQARPGSGRPRRKGHRRAGSRSRGEDPGRSPGSPP
ncbi:unnamed protein product [Prorocentrum cordatum]|uniref:Mei2-like C-terminal RNA recognition motif domain-containing protein n=1 Tax=Prorocentrum cordatum TaxID=2364126 RepID=A0ABN9TB66_9DINO|nr:unnamed protein product [Polarella glacialis]